MKRDPFVSRAPLVTLADNIATFFEKRVAFDNLPDDSKTEGAATELVVAGLSLIGQMVGDEAFAIAFGDGKNLSKSEGLSLLSRRLLLSSLLTARLPQDPYDVCEASREAAAVARGDKPLLFAQPERKKSFRLALYRLNALMWEAYLDKLGVALDERRAAIVSAFGDWQKIVKWYDSVPRVVDSDLVDYQLASAAVRGRKGEPAPMMLRGESWQDALARGGAEFRALGRATKG